MGSAVVILEPEGEPLLAPGAALERLGTGFFWAEGPVWHFAEGYLTFSDVVGNTVYRWDEAGGVLVHRSPSHHANGQTIDTEGRLVTCEHQTRRVTRESADGIETLARDFAGKRLNSPNDVVAAQDGSLLFTDPSYGLEKIEEGGGGTRQMPFQGVYRVPPGSRDPDLLVQGLSGPNGLALSPAEDVLYVADTDHAHIRSFRVGPHWSLTDTGVFTEVPSEGDERPDGMKVDVRGNVYCTGRGGIWVFSPAGTAIARILVPENTANLAWGDADASTLYITASSSIYRLRCRVAGYAPHGG